MSLRDRLSMYMLVALGAAATLAAQNAPGEPSLQGEGALKVMTYNMYAGTSYAGITSPDYATFLQASSNLILDVHSSDPAGRAGVIARQIAATMPHLVSLQEAATWSTGQSTNSLTVEFDYVQVLLEALAAIGQQYTAAASLTHFDATLPTSTGYVRNTWRTAILARADLKPEDFTFTNVQMSPWSAAATLSYPLPALDGSPDCPVPLSGGRCVMPFPRGWVAMDVTYREKDLRYINAHLESRSASRNIREGLELLNGPADTALPVVVAADLNCDLANPGDTKYQTCQNFLDAGFEDAWDAAHPFELGFTKDLPLMTMRGDYVMARGRFHVQAAVRVGEELEDMTPTGLWASNHCGVVARLQLAEIE